jgi:hypothetical protein
MKSITFVFIILFASLSYGQFVIPTEDDSLKMYESDPVPIYNKDYMRQYNRFKRIIKKVYPYALYASDMLYQLEADAEELTRKRKKKKFYKQAYKDLKTDFKFVFMDLYTSEGRMLMKLVHRETGMTVYEIAEKYRGKKNASMFNLMGKIWDQDVKIKYDPTGTDKIAEHVIQDIESGLVDFENKVVRVNKDQYKLNQKAYKNRVKENKKRRKMNKKACKKKEKQDKKEE